MVDLFAKFLIRLFMVWIFAMTVIGVVVVTKEIVAMFSNYML